MHYPDQALDSKVTGGYTNTINYQAGQYATGGNTYNVAPQVVYTTGQPTTTTNYVY